MTRSAALAYYTVFSLPPLLVIVLAIAGYFFGEEAAHGRLSAQISDLIGRGAAGQIEVMVRNAAQSASGGGFAVGASIVALVFAGTTALTQLQRALNRAWEVAPDPDQPGIKNFAIKRLLSFGMIVGIAFLLLVSLVLSTALAATRDRISGILPSGMSMHALMGAHIAASFAITMLLFALMFKVLPDAVVAWRDVWAGGAATAVLFYAGKFFVGFYIGRSDPGSTYGAAGSLAVILLWTYYSAMIVLLGAELTQAFARAQGREIVPEKGAVRLIEDYGRRTPHE